MGTNYYYHKQEACKCCGRNDEPVHIGKSSGGWCFSMHIDEYEGIKNYDDWKKLFEIEGSYIEDEYGDVIDKDYFCKSIVEDRHWRGEHPSRHEIDGRHCVGHGEGTWDYITGNFS